MKTIINKNLILYLLIIFASSCAEQENQNPKIINQNEIIFEDLSLLDNVSSNFYDNHFYLVELIREKSEKTDFLSKINDTEIDIKKLNTNEIKKFYLNNSDVLIYSIPFVDSNKKIIAYRYDELYYFTLSETNKTKGVTEYKFNTLNNDLFYSIELNDENKLGTINVAKNSTFNLFSDDVNNLFSKKYHTFKSNSLKKDAECCRKESDWDDCLTCTINYCGSKWWCAAGLVVAGPEALAAFAVSCVGANSDAWC